MDDDGGGGGGRTSFSPVLPDYGRLERELAAIRAVSVKLMRGATLTKHRRGTAQRRRVWLSDDCQYILWGRVGRNPSARGAVRGRLAVEDVIDVRLGTTAEF